MSIPVDGRVEFGHTASAAAQQLACAPQDPPRVTAEADVAVGQQHRLPPAGPRQRIEHVAAKRRGAAAARQRDGGRGLVDPERRHAALDQVGHQTPRAATQVDRRAVAQRRPPRCRTARRRRGRPASCAPAAGRRGRRRGGPNIAHRRARGRRDCRACQTPSPGRAHEPAVRRAVARGRRRRRRWCPRPPARQPGSHANPCRASAASVTAPVSERDIGIARRQSAIAASVTPSTHQPPSRARPSTASVVEQCLRAFGEQFGGHLRGVHAICSTGSPPAAAAASTMRVGQPRRRSRRRAASTTVKSARRERISAAQLAGAEVARQRHHPRLQPALRPPRRACPAARRRRCRRRPASPTLAASRVFACPGTGALATTSTIDGYHEIARQKSSAAMKLPRTDPLTFDLPPVRGP